MMNRDTSSTAERTVYALLTIEEIARQLREFSAIADCWRSDNDRDPQRDCIVEISLDSQGFEVRIISPMHRNKHRIVEFKDALINPKKVIVVIRELAEDHHLVPVDALMTNYRLTRDTVMGK